MQYSALDREPGRLGPWLKRALLALGTVLLGLVALGLVLVHRGDQAMSESDRAFHAGDLRVAVWEAKEAGLAYVPGSAHVGRSTARLEAIARGAAAEGRWDMARLAWDALRLVDEQTAYPGRGQTAAGRRAEEELRRMGHESGDPRDPGRGPSI